MSADAGFGFQARSTQDTLNLEKYNWLTDSAIQKLLYLFVTLLVQKNPTERRLHSWMNTKGSQEL